MFSTSASSAPRPCTNSADPFSAFESDYARANSPPHILESSEEIAEGGLLEFLSREVDLWDISSFLALDDPSPVDAILPAEPLQQPDVGTNQMRLASTISVGRPMQETVNNPSLPSIDPAWLPLPDKSSSSTSDSSPVQSDAWAGGKPPPIENISKAGSLEVPGASKGKSNSRIAAVNVSSPCPAKIPKKRGRRRVIRTKEEEQRRFVRQRERNRIAAQTCRIKKKAEELKLETHAGKLKRRYLSLRDTINRLKIERLGLKEELMHHRNCGNSEIEIYLQSVCIYLMDSISSSIASSSPTETTDQDPGDGASDDDLLDTSDLDSFQLPHTMPATPS